MLVLEILLKTYRITQPLGPTGICFYQEELWVETAVQHPDVGAPVPALLLCRFQNGGPVIQPLLALHFHIQNVPDNCSLFCDAA